MKSKSGLADSPFFQSIKANAGTNVQMNKRTVEQSNERSDVQGYRIIVRKSYDVFLDQDNSIDELVVKRQRDAGKHVKKGEIMREIVDFFFKHNKLNE